MKKLTLLFTVCLLMTISCFSQSIYPQKLVIGKDTVVAILPTQLRDINLLLNERLMLKEVVVETQQKIKEVNLQIIKMNQLNADKTKLIDLQQKQIDDYTKFNQFADQNIQMLKDEIKVQKKKKFKTMLVSIVGTALVTTTGVLLLKP